MINTRYPDINRIFDELDAYLEFCKEFGFVYNEKDLWNYKSPYGLFDRYRKGHRINNNWEEDRVNVILN
jgi:hypothetical protein